jgi:trk system potassium uptake protein
LWRIVAATHDHRYDPWCAGRSLRSEVVVHVVIVGCGRVGSTLARTLIESGREVVVVDRRPEAFARLGDNFAGRTVLGVGFDRDVLREAGIDQASAVAAVTSGDNSNILIARVARETFGIERVVARIYDPRRAAIYQRLGIPTVATVAWTAERVLRRLTADEAAVEWVDPTAKVMLVERAVGATWAGRKVADLEAAIPVRFAAVSRLGVSSVPTGGLILQDGDLVYIATDGDHLAVVDASLASPAQKASH